MTAYELDVKHSMGGCLESNIQGAVNRKSNEKKVIYKKYVILELLLDVVTARIEALVLGNKFLYAYVKTSATY
jgi:hypothetical protein